MAHIPSWLWQSRAPEPGCNQDTSLQGPGLRHLSALGEGHPGQAPMLRLQVEEWAGPTLLRAGGNGKLGGISSGLAGQSPRPRSAPKVQKQVLEHQDCHNEKTGGPGAPRLHQSSPQFLQERDCGQAVGWAGLAGKKDQWSLLE